MSWAGADAVRGLDALRTAVARLLLADRIALAAGPYALYSEALADGGPGSPTGPSSGGPDGFGDADQAASSEDS